MSSESARAPATPEGSSGPGGSPPVSASSLPAPWLADCGDGTYRNPILHADYSDPDVVRVGNDYWMTASSFGHVPGLPILHSRDLVNWSLVNHALPRLVPEGHFSHPRHGDGVWAPSIRFHAGLFWIFYPDPDFGIHVITAEDPRGRWSEPHLVVPGKGLIDPCPLWDDDGRCYLVHGWARSRSGINNVLTLRELSPDARAVLGEGRTVIDANAMPGWHTLEGPKLYKRDGWYWIFAPAGGVGEGYQAVFRSQRIDGPYEPRIVLAQGSTPVNGPHQGAWVDTPAGEHWFVHFQELPAYGRLVHLQPMRWREDGWPEMGVRHDDSDTGEPVLHHLKPALPVQPIVAPPTSDDFSAPTLGLQWQWQANPDETWYALDRQARALTLRCVPLRREHDHWSAGHLLMQKFVAPAFSATVQLRLDARAEGDRAGLIVFGHDYAWLGLRQRYGRAELVFSRCHDAAGGHIELLDTPPFEAVALAPDSWLTLRVNVERGGMCRFGWSLGKNEFVELTPHFQARSSRWVGAKVGIFASASPQSRDPGSAQFQNFSVATLK